MYSKTREKLLSKMTDSGRHGDGTFDSLPQSVSEQYTGLDMNVPRGIFSLAAVNVSEQ